MPKAKQKRYSVKRRRRGGGKTSNGKTSNGKEDDELDRMEKGLKYGVNTSAPYLYDTTKKTTILEKPPILPEYTKQETEDYFSQREVANKEFEDLTEKFASDQQKQRELAASREILEKPLTAEEAEKIFDRKIEEEVEECVGPNCTIMGGKKSRNKRRKGRKTRKSRKSYKSHKSHKSRR